MYLPLIKKLAPYLIVALLAGLGVYNIQQLRIDKIKTELTVCHDANAASAGTIKQMKADAAKNRSICEKTLRSTERAIAELKRIDNLTSSPRRGEERGEGEANETIATDPLLHELNGMFTPAR